MRPDANPRPTEGARIVALVISDRASRGEYADLGGPAISAWLSQTVTTAFDLEVRVIADGRNLVAAELKRLCDEENVALVLTTGGTGPAPRDETPEAMEDILEKELPGFGELMRRRSLEEVPTAILSRQTAGIRGRTLIVNLPGNPAAIRTCLDAVFPAIPYCLDLIGASALPTNVDGVHLPACLRGRPGLHVASDRR